METVKKQKQNKFYSPPVPASDIFYRNLKTKIFLTQTERPISTNYDELLGYRLVDVLSDEWVSLLSYPFNTKCSTDQIK